MLVDTRTKEATLYRQPGATESAAMQSAMGKVQEKGYQSSFPIMYNIAGIPTYVMSLKDQAGLIKMIAMVSVQDYSIVGVGDDLKETLRKYKEAFGKNGNTSIVHSKDKMLKLSGKVSRISMDISGGNTYYYLMLEGMQDKIFVSTSSLSKWVPLTQEGDSINIQYDEIKNNEIEILEFVNSSLLNSK
jgi:hypothetical protein